MEKETRIALDEFLQYQAQVNDRVNKYADEVDSKKKEVATLEADFAKSFISGNVADEKKLNKAKNDLSDSESRLELLKVAKENDTKLIELADEVYKEFYKSKKLIQSINVEKRNEINELESLLEKKTRELKSEDNRLNLLLKEQSQERLQAFPYMTLDTADKNRYLSLSVNDNYSNYLKRNMNK